MTTGQVALWVIVLLVLLALAFDFMNGFHDAANSIATVVSTGVLKPAQAVLFAAVFNFVAIFIFHLSVAATVGKGPAVGTGATIAVSGSFRPGTVDGVTAAAGDASVARGRAVGANVGSPGGRASGP